MELDAIDCVSSSDGMDEDEIHHHNLHHHHHQFASSESYTVNANSFNNNISNIVGPTAIPPATSVHELLECPVCTNFMYPPIHQERGIGFGNNPVKVCNHSCNNSIVCLEHKLNSIGGCQEPSDVADKLSLEC